jgi:hypothetical protein
MCSPKIGEDFDEEDEVSDRAQRTIGAIALMMPAMRMDRAGGQFYTRDIELGKQ